MSNEQIKTSGLLELYVIGDIEMADKLLVEEAIKTDLSIKEELKAIEISLKEFAMAHAFEPDPTTMPMLLATVDYTERLKNGEKPVNPPSLHKNSKVVDFSQWLDRKDMQEPDEYGAMHGKIIGSNEEKTTLIVWLRYGAPDETHTNEIEKFLVVEGTCDITIDDKIHSLKPGDFLSIPLFVNHNVKVTSEISCKVILERAAA